METEAAASKKHHKRQPDCARSVEFRRGSHVEFRWLRKMQTTVVWVTRVANNRLYV